MSQPSWWQDVTAHIEAFQQADPQNLPGAVFAAETLRDGPLFGAVGQGWTNDTICEIGSMTKVFTATAVLLALEEHGRLDVDTPVWKLPGMELYAQDPVKRSIRIRHLLQHTTGMPVFLRYTEGPKTPCNDPEGELSEYVDPDLNLGPTVPWIGSPGYTNEYIYADGRCRPARQLSLDQVSRYIMQTYPLCHKPGEQYTYSSANYIVAARIVEQLSAQSLNRFLQHRLFLPLDMTDSFFIAQPTGDADVDARLDEGVTPQQRQRIPEVSLITRDGAMPPEVAPGPEGRWDRLRRGWRFVYPDGGMYATASDLLQFLRLLREGGRRCGERILSEEIVGMLVGDQGMGHTLGMGYRRQPTPYGQGEGTLEHLGNIMTYFWYDPRPGNPLLGVFLSQRLANAVVNNNMAAGMKVIFRVFVSQVNRALYGFQPDSV
jgi:CubicO group peptidase (beta-lactamase class C family)